MALSLAQTDAIQRLAKPGMRVCSFGYPDIIAPVPMEGLTVRPDSDAICKRHGLAPRPIPDAVSFFALYGCSLDVYDVVRERGCEILCDLNQAGHGGLPLYDIALDVGTAEHCFNIGQALMNMAGVVKEGGWIIHENPANWANHGFYNLCPTLFADFYAQNGFRVEELRLVTRDGREAAPPPTARFHYPPEEVNIYCAAQRLYKQALTYPVQSKYRHLIQPAAGASGEQDAAERAIGVANG